MAPKARVIAVVGRLIPIKDHETFFRAIAGLPDVHVLVAGDGELRRTLEQLVAALGLGNRVRFLGGVEDVSKVYAAADMTVLSSRREGTPVALIESLASSRPVVATDVGGVRSVVDDGKTGSLVPPGDASAITRAIDEMFSDSRRRSKMGALGAQSMSRFSLEHLVAEVRSLYGDLLQRRVS